MTRHRFCHGDSVDYWPGEITFGSAVATKVPLSVRVKLAEPVRITGESRLGGVGCVAVGPVLSGGIAALASIPLTILCFQGWWVLGR